MVIIIKVIGCPMKGSAGKSYMMSLCKRCGEGRPWSCAGHGRRRLFAGRHSSFTTQLPSLYLPHSPFPAPPPPSPSPSPIISRSSSTFMAIWTMPLPRCMRCRTAPLAVYCKWINRECLDVQSLCQCSC